MTRETRIALLVGLAIIILFGLVLGQRSMKIDPVFGEDLPMDPLSPTSPEIRAAQLAATDRSTLSPPVRPAQATARRANVSSRRRPIAGGLMPAPVIREPAAPLLARPAPAPRPVAPVAPRRYTVRAGDNLIAIARRVYGRDHESEYTRIYQANRDKMRDESTVRPGQVLTIPPLAGAAEVAVAVRTPAPASPPRHFRETTLEALRHELAAPRRPKTYTVKPGDNLSIIAREQMGDPRRQAVAKLFAANRDRLANPNSLSVGMTLRIP